MENFTKINVLKAAVAAVALLSTTTASALSVNVNGWYGSVPNTGIHSIVTGAIEENFDVAPLGTIGSYAGTIGTYTGGAIVIGSSQNEYAAPPIDNTRYLTVGESSNQPSPVTLYLNDIANYFGYFAGSPDAGTKNLVEFWMDGLMVDSFTGDDLANAGGFDPDGDHAIGEYWNFTAGPTEYFNIVKFFSSQNAFETDNHAVSYVPLPAAAWLFGSALLGFAGFSNRRKV